MFTRSFFPRSTLVLLALLAAAWWSPASLAQGVARGVVYTRADVEKIIKRAESASDSFKSAVDRRLDRSRLNGSAREDFINNQVKQLETRLDSLRARFDKTDAWLETRAEVQAVIAAGRDVELVMRRPVFGRVLGADGRALRVDLNTLAGVYDIPRI